VTAALTESAEIEAASLQTTIRRLIHCSIVVPLTSDILKDSIEVETQFQLAPQDAVVFTTVDSHVRAHANDPKVFINKNQTDFLTPQIEAHFESLNCKLLGNFSNARQYIESRL
jgi:hypothetical protein